LVLTEESKRIPHELTSAETKQRERGYGYGYGIPDWDYLPTGRLVLRNDHGGYGSTIMAADRQRWALDDKLPLALSKMEEKAAAADGFEHWLRQRSGVSNGRQPWHRQRRTTPRSGGLKNSSEWSNDGGSFVTRGR
jgi:hypothetical protein